ncbi:MAG: hypothetical protein ACLU37_10060 [Collinsella sp.]
MFNINSTLSRRNFLAGAAGARRHRRARWLLVGWLDSGSADDGKTFKIGVSGPLTGAAATYGVSAEKGAKLAAKDFSTKDLKLSLKTEDDVADGEKAINAFNTLCDWGMQALVAPSRLVPPSPSRARLPTICSWSRLLLRPRRHQGQDHGFPGLLYRPHHGHECGEVLGREVCRRQDRPVLQLRRYV